MGVPEYNRLDQCIKEQLFLKTCLNVFILFRSLRDCSVSEITLSRLLIIFQKEGVDVLLVQFLESSLEQSQIAPFPIGDGTFSKE